MSYYGYDHGEDGLIEWENRNEERMIKGNSGAPWFYMVMSFVTIGTVLMLISIWKGL